MKKLSELKPGVIARDSEDFNVLAKFVQDELAPYVPHLKSKNGIFWVAKHQLKLFQTRLKIVPYGWTCREDGVLEMSAVNPENLRKAPKAANEARDAFDEKKKLSSYEEMQEKVIVSHGVV
ncbi:hypothetical protein [Thioclava kandeliae]|uniref:Uncharacterized protein n=1 Tax=Thioclava kandeliae TaxID=3070818 RepID=A0ABV1SNM5_9RHOB